MTQAHISWGRWCVECECHSAMRLDNREPEIVCIECGVMILVEYPLQARMIEAVLAQRPPVKIGSQWLPNHRNWRPGESLAAIRQENRDHGLD